jgi:hypothetical protein
MRARLAHPTPAQRATRPGQTVRRRVVVIGGSARSTRRIEGAGPATTAIPAKSRRSTGGVPAVTRSRSIVTPRATTAGSIRRRARPSATGDWEKFHRPRCLSRDFFDFGPTVALSPCCALPRFIEPSLEFLEATPNRRRFGNTRTCFSTASVSRPSVGATVGLLSATSPLFGAFSKRFPGTSGLD